MLTQLHRADNAYWKCEWRWWCVEYGMMLNTRSLDTAGTEQFSKSHFHLSASSELTN
jgi:hypothetical protein